MTRQMQLYVVILRKCKEVDQCPHVISTSAVMLRHTVNITIKFIFSYF